MDVLTDQGPDTGAVIRERKVREAPRKAWGLGTTSCWFLDFGSPIFAKPKKWLKLNQLHGKKIENWGSFLWIWGFETLDPWERLDWGRGRLYPASAHCLALRVLRRSLDSKLTVPWSHGPRSRPAAPSMGWWVGQFYDLLYCRYIELVNGVKLINRLKAYQRLSTQLRGW